MAGINMKPKATPPQALREGDGTRLHPRRCCLECGRLMPACAVLCTHCIKRNEGENPPTIKPIGLTHRIQAG